MNISNLIRPRMPQAVQAPTRAQVKAQNLQTTWKGLLIWLMIAIVAIVSYSWSPDLTKLMKFASGALLVAAASSSVGILLGFLFGIPRSLQQEGGAPVKKPSSQPGSDNAAAQSRLAVNTNLEQISDWLTKILVGVGLTQLRDLGPRLWMVATRIAPVIGDSIPVALTVIVNFTIWGFFVGYLLTRLFLASAFSVADSEAEQLVQQEEKAFDLTQKGAHANAANQYAAALEQITSDTPPAQRQRIYEGIVYNSLYQPPPDGYLQAIRYAQEYSSDPSNPPSARIYAYLSAAYGQQYADRRKSGAGADELTKIRDNALSAAKEALRLDLRLKTLLRMLWDPNDPTKVSAEDDDLEPFHDDDGFKALFT